MGERILIVDNDPVQRRLLDSMVRKLGYEPVAAAGGEAAVAALLGAGAARIDAVVLDLVMPDVDGMELAGKILAKRPDIKILVMSGYADDVVVHGIFEKKSVDFLGKPFSIRDLFTKVSVLLAQSA